MDESLEIQLGRLLEGGEQRTKTLERIELALIEDRKVNSRTRDMVLAQRTQVDLLRRLIGLALAGLGALGAVTGIDWFVNK